MSVRPVVVPPGESEAEVERLMRAARVRHLPVIDEGRVAGLWVRPHDGPLRLLGADAVFEIDADADADAAMQALLSRHEAVLAREGGSPAGLLTRGDLLDILRVALGRGIGRRHHRAVVMRVVGPAGAGKTTLLTKTIERLARIRPALVQANAERSGRAPDIAGAPVLQAPDAHWRRGLARAVQDLADHNLVLVEDRDGPPVATSGVGEDLQVVVVRADDAPEVTPTDLRDAQALVITHVDQGSDIDLAAEVARLSGSSSHLALFTLSPRDDAGLGVWARWVESKVLPRMR